MQTELDILAFAAHPDDTELACAGTLYKHVQAGYRVGVVDLTYGQLSTLGDLPTRAQEAKSAAQILGLSLRENLGLEDGFFVNDASTRLKIIQVLRYYRPRIVLANAIQDRHPDHGRAAELVVQACFYSGLAKIKTWDAKGLPQAAFRPKAVYHYIQDDDLNPDFVVDITAQMDKKMQAIRAFGSQFYRPGLDILTPIAVPTFLDFIEGRARNMGRLISTEFAEGFTAARPIQVHNLLEITKNN